IISGDKAENSQGLYDYWVVKLDASGTIQWQNTMGGSDIDNLLSIQQTSDGGYVLGGFSASPISGDKAENSLGFDDYWVVKLDASGAIQSQNTIGGSAYDELFSIQQTSDGGYVLGGRSESDISGDKTENCLGAYDYWVVKLDSLVGMDEQAHSHSVSIYPNPSDGQFTISSRQGAINKVEVYDLFGSLVLSTQAHEIDMRGFAGGVYVYVAKGEDKTEIGRGKVVIE
ncbi:MAG: T9SS type A sorting domain-containing protein, partial [Flavobacteriales bacterium]